MKRHVSIGLYLIVLAMLMACSRPDDALVETRHGTSQIEQVPEPAVPEDHRRVEWPSLALSAIDSLMLRQPDSALACLIPYFDTCCRDAKFCVSTTTEYNRHYANILLAELLYKNDYAQTNRQDLQKAVAYFDSLTLTLNDTPTLKRLIAGAAPLSLTRNDRITFLTARAHYINGVGYYERDSLVEACKEYLKALEVMGNHFEKKDLVGTKAKFMAYTYNRLGDLFSEQFMMDPAIDCFKHSYNYSVISPISSYSVSNALYRIGKQYNMKGYKDSADFFYLHALENMPDTNNLYYRDIVSTKSLLSYQLAHQAEASLSRLKQMVVMAKDDDEILTRYLLIGSIYFEERRFDSARLYLEPVFMNKDDAVSIQIADYLRILYDSLNDKEKSNYYVHFLAANKSMEYESDVKVSSLSELYKSHLEKKQKKQAEKDKKDERKRAIKKTIVVIIPILFLIVFIIILLIRNKHRKSILAKEEFHQQQMEAKEANAQKRMEERDKQHAETIEAERQAHRMEQAAISGRLKRKNEEVRELKDQINQQNRNPFLQTETPTATFMDEPICRLILERVREGQFKSQMNCTIYRNYALSKDQLITLQDAANRHFDRFTERLARTYPDLTNSDLGYCCLYLLGLSDADVSALMQKAYPTVSQRSRKIKAILGTDSSLPLTLRGIANNGL